MKHVMNILILAMSLYLTSCATANTYLKQGRYEAAIQAAVKKLRKFPKKADKHILALEKAWNIEQQSMLQTIDQLKLEGQPENWVEIHSIYANMDYYQRLVQPVLPLFIKSEFRNADIQILDIKQELADTKAKAAEFMYANGIRLLEQGDKYSAREAYYQFRQVKDFYTTYQDIDAKLVEARDAGMNHILLSYANGSNMIIPQQFMTNIQSYDERALNSEWTSYYKNANVSVDFDYTVEVVITNVDIGPEQVRESSYIDTKEIQDGFDYVLDANGNVMKDSLGNDIKIPRYVTISATVIQAEQTKVGTLAGMVSFIKADGREFQTYPFREDLVFRNVFASFTGNKQALSKESLARIGGQPLPFPQDIQMVMDASEIIKNRSFQLIRNNTGLLSN